MPRRSRCAGPSSGRSSLKWNATRGSWQTILVSAEPLTNLTSSTLDPGPNSKKNSPLNDFANQSREFERAHLAEFVGPR